MYSKVGSVPCKLNISLDSACAGTHSRHGNTKLTQSCIDFLLCSLSSTLSIFIKTESESIISGGDEKFLGSF